MGENLENDTLGIKDLVFSSDKNGNINAGGFMIENSFLKKGIPPMVTTNKNNMEGGSVSSLFKDLAVPAGLLYIQQTMAPRHYHEKHHEMMECGIFDKLLGLAKDKPERKLTKKTKKQKGKNTRKNRK